MFWKIVNIILYLTLITMAPILKASQHLFLSVTAINEAKLYFDNADENTLILFDVDSTLTTPSDAYLRRRSIQQHKTIYDNMVFSLTKNQNRIFNHILVIQSFSQLVEDDWPAIIAKLQRKKCKTLALTAAKTGALGSILKSFPEWRYQELKRLGIDFSTTFSESVLFKNVNDFGGEHPGMEKGIVYCGHQAQKGDLLINVLKVLQFTPHTIIFVDDKIENLNSLSNTIKTFFSHINFVGIHYKGMERLADVPTNQDIFKMKMTMLIEMTKHMCKD